MSNSRVCLVGATVLLVCTMLYVPLLLLGLRPPPVLEWMSMKRDLRLYVTPDNDTALVVAEGACVDAASLVVVVVVCSAVGNNDARAAIRSTWGSRANGSDARLVFLLGRPENETLLENAMKESDEHGDVVLENFLDTYNNLTLKSVMMLKWVESHCGKAQYLLKTDDDSFVNLDSLISLLKQRGRPNLLVGSLICGAVPIRDRKSKWFSPFSMFNEHVYPNYLSGTAYVMSRDLVRPLYDAALAIPFFHLEDVFITGICARKIHVRPRNHGGFNYQRRQMDPCLFRRILTSHRMTPHDMRTIWRGMHQQNLLCDSSARTKSRENRQQHCQ